MRFGGKSVAVLFEECADVAFRVEASGTVFIVPVKFDAGVLPNFPFGGDGVVIFKYIAKVFGVVFLNIIDAKIVYY